MADLDIRMAPRVRIVLRNEDSIEASFADLQRGDDPATISDAELLERVANYLDRPVEDLGELQVTRPETGNILVSEKPVYG